MIRKINSLLAHAVFNGGGGVGSIFKEKMMPSYSDLLSEMPPFRRKPPAEGAVDEMRADLPRFSTRFDATAIGQCRAWIDLMDDKKDGGWKENPVPFHWGEEGRHLYCPSVYYLCHLWLQSLLISFSRGCFV